MDDRYSQDTLFNGRLLFMQPRAGYRFSIDALIVAACFTPKADQRVLDLGTGCGVIPIVLAFRHPGIRITGVEIQPELAELARRNVRDNNMQDRIAIIEADMRNHDNRRLGGPFDWIVCNPPYRRSRSGRVNPNNQRAAARHEINIDLEQLIRAVKSNLYQGGRFVVIYPVDRLADLIATLCAADIEPKWLRSVHSFHADPAKWILVQAVKGAGPGLKMAAPLIVYESEDHYTPQVKAILSADGPNSPTTSSIR